ncbi:hypothetical protein NW762_011014 [Fusarium torreyae]|uniref:Uncharacterized protein n=1 Tax=Fusarium torreyae TaxID=1237075 RepID=A0A9W8VA79_9HYPO|nr:hypothetical protein NW762_011014 [Fusarium torreyae]
MTRIPRLEPNRWSLENSRRDKTSADTALVVNKFMTEAAIRYLLETFAQTPEMIFDSLTSEEPTRQHQCPPAFVTPNERGESTSVTWPSHDTKTGGIPSYEVPGFINDIPINGLPDWGSSVDGVSESFVERHGLNLETTRSQTIRLPGGGTAESVGQIVGYFKFQHEARVYRRDFHVLRNCVYDLVLGRKFLDMTKTFTEFSQRVIKRIRPCVQRRNQLFLLDEAPKDRIRCALNGVEASAFPDTGSDLMLASGDFARRHNLKVHRGEKYRRPVELIDGTIIRTDGMVLGAELQFDVSTSASQVLDYDAYQTFIDTVESLKSHGSYPQQRTSFICDLHIIEDLPCDIILSNEFIFQNQVFSRFKHLFYSIPTIPLSSNNFLGGGILFMRISRGSRFSRWWSSRLRRQRDDTKKSAPSCDPVSAAGALSWEKRWGVEEARRNSAQLHIAVLPKSQRSNAQKIEDCRKSLWDKENPRLLSGTCSGTSITRIKRKEVPSSTSSGINSVEGSGRSGNWSTSGSV